MNCTYLILHILLRWNSGMSIIVGYCVCPLKGHQPCIRLKVFILPAPHQEFLCPCWHHPLSRTHQNQQHPLLSRPLPPFPKTPPQLSNTYCALESNLITIIATQHLYPLLMDTCNSQSSPYYRWGYVDLNM